METTAVDTRVFDERRTVSFGNGDKLHEQLLRLQTCFATLLGSGIKNAGH